MLTFLLQKVEELWHMKRRKPFFISVAGRRITSVQQLRLSALFCCRLQTLSPCSPLHHCNPSSDPFIQLHKLCDTPPFLCQSLMNEQGRGSVSPPLHGRLLGELRATIRGFLFAGEHLHSAALTPSLIPAWTTASQVCVT